jgi:hypothetical protein
VSTLLQPADTVQNSLASATPHALTAGSRLRMLALSLPMLVALVLWRVSLLHLNPYDLGDYGLPPALPLTWYLSLALAVVGAVAAITMRRTNGLIMVGFVVVVAVILFGTVPVLSAQPHYAWVYKHLGVVRYLEVHGKANPNVDIYNRWPGFFALGAVFSQLGGSPNPEVYAGWAELIFLVLDAVLVMAAVKAVTREIRIAACAGLFFVVTNWVGQTYYSPQAFAFVLALALTVILLRQLRINEPTYSPRLTRLLERISRVPQLSVQMQDTTKWPRWASITAVLGLDAVIVASHQLTPYMLLVSIALLMLVRVIRPWWMLAAIAVMTFGYLAANFHFIQHNYGLFTSIDPANNLYVEKYSQTPTAGKVFNTNVELVLIATVYLGSLCAVIRLLRRGLLMRTLPFVVLAGSPFFVLLGQSYGGEASLRIILFSSPWTGALIASALATIGRRRLRWVLTISTAIVFTSLFVPSFLGQEELNIISPAEVRASEWFYYHAQHGSVLVLAAPGFPYRYGGTYPDFSGPEGDANPNLMSHRNFQGQQLGVAQIPAVIAIIRKIASSGYISFTKDEIAYAQDLGITPVGALRHLETAIARSSKFRLWYANKDAQIYELTVRLGTATRHTPIRKVQLHNRLLSSSPLVRQLEFRSGHHNTARTDRRHKRLARHHAASRYVIPVLRGEATNDPA